MRISDFDLYSDLLARECGLHLTEDKSFIFDSRLQPVARKWGYFSLSDMGFALRGMPDKGLVKDVVEAMMSHESTFFRDPACFERLADTLIPALVREDKRRGRHRLRIWSAGCAAGQEAYSLAMVVRDSAALLAGWDVDIVATDLSHIVLEQAHQGLYSAAALQHGVTVQQMLSGFDREGEDGAWRVKPDIRRMVSFSFFNLLHDMKPLGVFDIIFCRHVLGVMTPQARADVLSRMSHHLAPDGFLVLGRDETIPDALSSQFRPAGLFPGLYVPAASPHRFS